MSLKFGPKGLMVWRRPGDKPSSDPMMVRLLMHVCVTQPHWVKPEYSMGTKSSICTLCWEIMKMWKCFQDSVKYIQHPDVYSIASLSAVFQAVRSAHCCQWYSLVPPVISISTYWHRDKMADIMQMTLLNAISSMKVIIFWLKYYRSLFPRVLIIVVSDDGLVPNRWQAIIWTNDGLVQWCIYASHGLKKSWHAVLWYFVISLLSLNVFWCIMLRRSQW